MAITEIEIPVLGMDTDTVPRLLPKTKAPLLKNFLMDRPGILPMRGPIREGITWAPGSSIGLFGVWHFDDKLLVGRYASSSAGNRTVDPWVAHYRPTSSEPELRDGDTGLKHIDLTTGTVTSVTASDADGVPGPKYVRVGNSVYGIGGDAVTNSSGAFGNVFKLTQLLRWDGTATEPVQYGANAPLGLLDIKHHYSRLFVLGDVSSSGNRLYWSDPLASDSTTLPTALTAWQDDLSGLTNLLVVGTAEASDFNVAMAHVGSNLCIFKRRSIWMLYGTSPANFVIKQVNNEVGCIDPRSVVEYDNGVYFMSERGFMFTDGVDTRNVSVGLASSLVANARKQVGANGVDGGYVRAALIGPGYILVTTGSVHRTSLLTTPDTDAWLLHAPTGSWQQLSSGAIGTIIAGGRTRNMTYLLTDTQLLKANYLFDPVAVSSASRGYDTVDSGTNKFMIPSRLITRTLELAAPPSESQLQRVTADYHWNLATGGWIITATTRGDTGVVDTTSTFGCPTEISTDLPTRESFDVFNETDEVYLDVQASAAAPAGFDKAELHRLMIESRETRPSRAAL